LADQVGTEQFCRVAGPLDTLGRVVSPATRPNVDSDAWRDEGLHGGATELVCQRDFLSVSDGDTAWDRYKAMQGTDVTIKQYGRARTKRYEILEVIPGPRWNGAYVGGLVGGSHQMIVTFRVQPIT